MEDQPVSRESSPSPQGGTFLIREDQPLPETPLGLKPGQKPKKGAIKDFFTPLALERMFDPPSPPPPPKAPDLTENLRSTTPPLPPPTKPALRPLTKPTTSRSKLSQSHVPPSQEAEAAPTELSLTSSSQRGSKRGDEIESSDLPGLVGFAGRRPSSTFKFTFHVPQTPAKSDPNVSHHYSPPNPTPNPRAHQTPETSWIHGREDETPPKETDAAVDPRLKLFHFKYDTFTRDHLGALADSIAEKGSPGDSEENADEEPVWRSTKRIKLSPPEDVSSRTSSSRDFRNSPWGKVQSRDYFKGSRSFARMVNAGSRLPSQISEAPSTFRFTESRLVDTLASRHPDGKVSPLSGAHTHLICDLFSTPGRWSTSTPFRVLCHFSLHYRCGHSHRRIPPRCPLKAQLRQLSSAGRKHPCPNQARRPQSEPCYLLRSNGGEVSVKPH